MSRHSRIIPLLTLAALIGAGSASAQFVVTTQDDNTIEELRNGSTMNFDSPGVGATAVRFITVRYQGPPNSAGEITEPLLEGSTTFTATTGPDFPIRLEPEENVTFTVTFDPNDIGPFSARLTLFLDQEIFGRRDTRRRRSSSISPAA